MHFLQLPSPLHKLDHHPGKERGIRIFMKRDDLIHPEISGNKWRKLKYNIENAKAKGVSILVTAGGQWSNHLAATAAAGNKLGFKTKAFVRGTEPKQWSDTLLLCRSQGMELHFLSKSTFDSQDLAVEVSDDEYWIPLGGENDAGVKGCSELVNEITIDFDMITLPFGTGTTMMGIGNSVPDKNLIGFSALGSPDYDSTRLNDWIRITNHVWVNYDYGFGGFARSTPPLENFIVDFYQQNKMMLDPVYTGKMMFGLFDLIQQGKIKDNSTIISIHTGGLQGLKGFPDLHSRLFTS
jgi:1-aminocyclopropane-1-carboxylate deaminase